MDFIALRKNTGDDRRRTHDMNTAAWIPDEFFFRLKKNEDWYFFCPSQCADLHESYGEEFNLKYKKYIERAEKGEIMFRKSPTKDVWREMLKTLFETSHPWITFKDPCNARYSNIHEGIVHSSNLCTEICLHTKPTKFTKDGDIKERGETAVCQLSSVNAKNHVKDGKILWDKLAKTVRTLVRAIDNAIDINFYPTKESEKSHLRNRPIGIGIMGYQDVCFSLGIAIDSDESEELAGKIQEFISYHAILASSELAKERGAYETYKGSLWDKGIFPVDSHIAFMTYRNSSFDKTTKDYETLDWSIVRESVKAYGMRNSNTMAIAPTATISYIQGCLQSIEPAYSVLFPYDNKSGSNFVIDALEFFKKDMKKLGLWNDKIISDLYSNDGDVSSLDIPEKYKKIYARCFDRDMPKLIKVNGKRQIWVDQGISFNVYNKTNSTKYLNDVYVAAWEEGLKTTYYLRGMSASKVTKISTREETKEPKQCALDNPNCESCQ
jgi:ribonucleoside-diphosphate reductase alpha chain